MENSKTFVAMENEVGLKEMEQGLYDWNGEVQQKKLEFNPVHAEPGPMPSPIGIVFKYGCYFALMIGSDDEGDQIKFWVDLLEQRGAKRTHGSYLVELTLMKAEFIGKCCLTIPKSANETLHGKLPVGMEKVKMSNLVGWSLKVKIEMLEDPDPMPLSNEVHAPVAEVKTLNAATQTPLLKDVGTLDQNIQTVFRQISILALEKLCAAENDKGTKANADGSVFVTKPILVERGSQTKRGRR